MSVSEQIHVKILLMGNFMKKLLVLLFILNFLPVLAEEAVQSVTQNSSLTTPQNIMFENCTKIFGVNKEKLFYLTLASISANRFTVEEMQTSNGYIIFSANHKKYLATIAKVDNSNAILKITPCDNIYNFPPGILINMFKYIDLNINTEIKL